MALRAKGNTPLACEGNLQTFFCKRVMVADKNLGQLWLDARVVCHESKEGHIGPGITSAGGFFAMRFARRQRMLRNDETLPFPIAVANSHINEQWDLPLVARVSPDTLCPLQK